MFKVLLLLIMLILLQARHPHLRHSTTVKPCLPHTNLGGQQKEETHANQARKHLTKTADQLNENDRKAHDRQPFPNLYTYEDENCIANGQEKRDRRIRRS